MRKRPLPDAEDTKWHSYDVSTEEQRMRHSSLRALLLRYPNLIAVFVTVATTLAVLFR